MKFQNTNREIIYPIAFALVLVIGILIGSKFQKAPGRPSLMVQPRTDKLTSVLQYIQEEYVDSVSMHNLIEQTIPSMLKNLDPHSVYIPASDLQAVNEPLEGNFDGIGVQFNMPNDTVIVLNTIVGGPSEKLGIQAGDRIITINDSLVAGVKIPQDSIVKLLKGKTGTKVKVGIKRNEVNELIDFEIVRGKIPIYSVDVSYMASPTIGYIKISKFARTTYREFIDAIEKLKKEGMTKVVIDLRGNNGGYLDAATNIANEFLPEGKLIVYTQGKARPRQNIYSTASGRCLDTEVAVIIDEFSASASEILAGAIQDNDRGVVIGRRSFGKGLVQEQILFSDGSAIRLTIARYYTPTGRSIQKYYEPGSDDYFYDISNRYMHGEFQEPDSIQFADSLKFTTPSGRTVYGGGGIMPDVFVGLDTTGVTPYFTKVSNRNLVYRFAFRFAEKHRKQLNAMKSFTEVFNFIENQKVFDEFIAFAQSNGIKPNAKEIKVSRHLIENQIKAYIARNAIDNDGYYPYIKNIDTTLKRTIQVLEENQTSQIVNPNQGSKLSMNMLLISYMKTSPKKEAIAMAA
ncbi:Peptidase family S41 [anaerobic digester metagenome]